MTQDPWWSTLQPGDKVCDPQNVHRTVVETTPVYMADANKACVAYIPSWLIPAFIDDILWWIEEKVLKLTSNMKLVDITVKLDNNDLLSAKDECWPVNHQWNH